MPEDNSTPPPSQDEKYDRLLLKIHNLVWAIYAEFGREPKNITIDEEYILRAVKTFVNQRMYKYDINTKRQRDAAELMALKKTPEGKAALEKLLRGLRG